MDAHGRTLMTTGCRDCDPIPKVPEAGSIVMQGDQPVQIMHNGVRVIAGGYHGEWMSNIIATLHGHHEPQEERIFDALLAFARRDSLICELGAFWSYYTLWYLTSVPGSKAVCVEPDPVNIGIGRKNAQLNGMTERILFHQAWVGGKAAAEATYDTESTWKPLTLPQVDMPTLFDLASRRDIEMLHLDAQGVELEFVRSMAPVVRNGNLRFFIVSTHHSSISGSATTHQDCIDAIREIGGHILVEHDVQESFSGDGMIAASFHSLDRDLNLPPISRNRAETSLFPRP